MFREMRKNKQQLSDEETVKILENGTSGVLAVSGDDEYPYAVPLSYVYKAGKIYFHCAKSGHKLDAIKKNAKVSFCVIAQDKVMPEEYTTYYRSAIVFGKARELTDKDEKTAAINLLSEKYYPSDLPSNREKKIANADDKLCMVEISIEHMTGKEAKKLAGKNNLMQ